jgi:hypothetical protein
MSRFLKPFKLLSLCTLILAVTVALLYQVLFNSNITSSRASTFSDIAKDLKELSKWKFQGEVLNKTSHDIFVTDYKYVHVIPPGESSKAVNVADVDSIVIKRPTLMNGNRFDSGVFKFCDYGKLEIRETDTQDQVLVNKGAFLCRLMNDFQHFDSIPDAFPGSR